MPLFPGLLVSSQRGREQSAASEIHYALIEECNVDPGQVKASDTRVSGLVTVSLAAELDYSKLLQCLMLLESSQRYFLHCQKIRPIQYVMPADLSKVKEQISMILPPMKGTFKIEINKRHTPLSSNEIIDAIAPLIDLKVDLENPDWVILVEIIADRFGISFIDPSLIFSTKVAFEHEKKEETNWFLE